jgi:hypothetical protein
MLPELVEETSLLHSHFVKEKISTEDIILLLDIILQRNSKLYNYMTIKFILNKFVLLNPNLAEIKLNSIQNRVTEALANRTISADDRPFFLEFCGAIAKTESHSP